MNLSPIPRLALAAAGVAALLLPGLAPLPARTAPSATLYAAVPGALPLSLRRALGTPLGSVDSRQRFDLAFGLTSRDPGGLARELDAVYDPRSLSYRHFLTPAQYAARFGPDPVTVQALTTWLRAEGLHVDPWLGGPLLDVQGSGAQIGAALHLHLLRYRLAGGERYLADASPSLPVSLADGVLGVSGLDNLIRARPQAALAHPAGNRSAHRAAIGYGPAGGMNPSQVQSAYNFKALYAEGLTGAGINIDLVELAPYDPGDIAAYTSHYGVSPTITDHQVDGGAAGQAPSPEPSLDIEEISTSAPGATITVYSAPNDYATGLLHAYSAVAQARDAQVVSLAWDTCEPLARTFYGFAEIEHAAFVQMAMEGMTVVGATGDDGAYSCGTSGVGSLLGQLAVSLPASDPYVTAVGSTDMTLSPQDTIASETAWSCPASQSTCDTARAPDGDGSGGGLSSIFGRGDAFNSNLSWQVGPGVQNSYSNGFRQVPDVAISGTYTSGNDHAYSFYWHGRWQTGGGTSAAAPMWACLMALTAQYLQAHGQQRLGWANPLIYAVGAKGSVYPPFHDITSGDNLYYPATPGWDFASGWGSPDAYNFVHAVAALVPAIPAALPALTVAPPTATMPATSTPTAARPNATAARPAATAPRALPTVTATPRPTIRAACPATGLGNGGFEAGSLLCWHSDGVTPVKLVRAPSYGGHYSALLGSDVPPIRPGFAILGQSFALPAALHRPMLHLDYWLTHVGPTCPKGARCPAVALLPAWAQILDAKGHLLAHAALVPHRERAWSGLALSFPARGSRFTVQIVVPAEPAHTGLALYVDDVFIGT